MGLALITYDKLYAYEKIEKEDKKVEEFFIKKHKQRKIGLLEEYIGTIEIPKIKLKKGFYDLYSIHNNIEENITILKKEKDIIVLAAHSGNSHISYFKDLYKLDIDDTIYIYFNDKKYEYKVIKYYEESKDGDINIKDNSSNKKLILTTCKSAYKQIVYIAHSNS